MAGGSDELSLFVKVCSVILLLFLIACVFDIGKELRQRKSGKISTSEEEAKALG
jgi:hypothetical protein